MDKNRQRPNLWFEHRNCSYKITLTTQMWRHTKTNIYHTNWSLMDYYFHFFLQQTNDNKINNVTNSFVIFILFLLTGWHSFLYFELTAVWQSSTETAISQSFITLLNKLKSKIALKDNWCISIILYKNSLYAKVFQTSPFLWPFF